MQEGAEVHRNARQGSSSPAEQGTWLLHGRHEAGTQVSQKRTFKTFPQNLRARYGKTKKAKPIPQFSLDVFLSTFTLKVSKNGRE